MPQLLIRGLSADLRDRVRAYARARALSTPDAAAELLTLGLQMATGRSAGGKASQAARSADERREAAQHAARARWGTDA